MKLRRPGSFARPERSFRARRGFTVVEVLVASAIALMAMAATMAFMFFASRSLAGVTSQAYLNQEVGKATQVIFGRIRQAGSVATDASGNMLTLGFDDNVSNDSDNDGNAFNDKNHFERFEFRNGDGNDSTITNNTLVYLPDTNSAAFVYLLRTGVQKLPNQKVFALTNLNTVLINFGALDYYTGDWNQSADVQLTVVPRNRPVQTNTIAILP